jgi:hypothetical protein
VEKSDMIASNELRKGSCVMLRGAVCYVSQILWNRVEVYQLKDGSKQYEDAKLEELQPIEVTPEIVMKCGWTRHKRFPHRDVFISEKENFIINVMSGVSEVSFGLNGNFSLVANRTLYLHQFQNIYFALINEELLIDL